jgi:hypothetical protein
MGIGCLAALAALSIAAFLPGKDRPVEAVLVTARAAR